MIGLVAPNNGSFGVQKIQHTPNGNEANEFVKLAELNGERIAVSSVDGAEIGHLIVDPSGESHEGFVARMEIYNAQKAWFESAEGQAWQADQLEKQNAAPVELAVFQGDQLVAFKSEGQGFAARGSLSDLLPDNWGELSPAQLRDALEEQLSDIGVANDLSIRIARDGLAMNTGQATTLFNQH